MNNDKKIAKAKRNKRHYEKSKNYTEAVLLRLPTGSKAQIDYAASSFGVARPALFDLYLLPFLGVLSLHQRVLQELAQRSGCSIPTLIERLIWQAQAEPFAPEVPADIAASFDALFASSDGEV